MFYIFTCVLQNSCSNEINNKTPKVTLGTQLISLSWKFQVWNFSYKRPREFYFLEKLESFYKISFFLSTTQGRTFLKYHCQVSASIYMLKVRNTRASCKIYSKLTIKTAERHQWCHSGVFNVNFELISHIFLVFLLLTLTYVINHVIAGTHS